jgi:hypothetical protein
MPLGAPYHLPDLAINHLKHSMVHGLPRKADSCSAGQVMPYFCGALTFTQAVQTINNRIYQWQLLFNRGGWNQGVYRTYGETENAYKIFVRKFQGKRPRWERSHIWKKIKNILGKIWCECVDWLGILLNGRSLSVMRLRVPFKWEFN